MDMNEEYQLFQAALEIKEPWYVLDYELNQTTEVLDIYIDFKRGAKFTCSNCGHSGNSVHDILNDDRVWKHLKFWQYTTYIHARHPRIKCKSCGKIRAIQFDWARQSSGFTWNFEAYVMDLMKELPVSSVAKRVGEHDTRLWRIFHYYVDKSMKEMDFSTTKRIAIDETSSRRGHKYVTLFIDIDSKKAMFVTEGKSSQTLTEYAKFLTERDLDHSAITDVCSDMSPAFIKGVEETFPSANITFDKFHVMKLFNETIDEVRRQEQKETPILKKTRFSWLKNQDKLTEVQYESLMSLKDMNLKTAKAYRFKLAMQHIWTRSPLYAGFLFDEWNDWAIRSQIKPIIKLSKTLKKHREGILNWFQSQMTNGLLEGINGLVQTAKRKARGYRSIRNYIAMIYATVNKLDIKVMPH